MPKKIPIQFILFALFGIALLLAGLFFQNGLAVDSAQAQAVATPTLDRLAEPTLPAQPSQADYGSQIYWLNCSPCHGDRGQGLTDEFRQQYPPEDQNCWKSHCHGNVTYDNGFKIPKVVPQLIGPGALAKFPNAASLYGFIHAAMPFQRPGSLTDKQYYQLVAFLLRQNKLIDSQTEVTVANATAIVVSHATPTVQPQSTLLTRETTGSGNNYLWLIVIGLVLLGALTFILIKIQNQTKI